MTPNELEALALHALGDIAPEIDGTTVDRHQDLREQLDIDSVDFLGFVTALSKATGIDIPEVDYPRLYTLEGAIDYLSAKQPLTS